MKQQSFFEREDPRDIPLATRMRPRTLEEFVGQEHLLGEGKVLRQLIEQDRVSSMIFWGPPGVGKTTLARIIAGRTQSNFINFSAVTSGIMRSRGHGRGGAEPADGRADPPLCGRDPPVQQGPAGRLPALCGEGQHCALSAPLTENPSFEVNSALLSRCKVFVLQALTPEDLVKLLQNALRDPRGFGGQDIRLEEGMLEAIANFANGDARTALGTLEMVVLNGRRERETVTVTQDILEQCVSRKSLLYDKNGEEHYNLISALHKSMRNSDPDAAVYWLARMLEAGEDPLYVARRLIRFASEDVGMADSRALEIATACYQACHFIGMPECSVTLTHCVVYLSLAPKSNALYKAYEAAKRDAQKMLAEPVPLVIRNAPTRLMKDLHYGEGYVYAHDTEEKLTSMQCLPTPFGRTHYCHLGTGSEARAAQRLEQIQAWKRAHSPAPQEADKNL